MGTLDKDFLAIVLLALGKKGKLTGMSNMLLWLHTTTAFSKLSKLCLPLTEKRIPDKSINVPIHHCETIRCHFVFRGSGNTKQYK